MRDPWSEEVEAIRRLAESALRREARMHPSEGGREALLRESLDQIIELCEGSECAVWQTTEGTSDA